MRRRAGLVGLAALISVLSLRASGADAEDPSLGDPRLGGPSGRLRYRIARSPSELREVPDVITLADGRCLEVYFLETYGDRLVGYVKETEDSWLREEFPREEVARVEFHQFLDRDPLAPRVIRRARKQPVRKEEILSGVYEATQGRRTRWSLSFHAEIDKFRDFSEDATEWGSFEFESGFAEEGLSGAGGHQVRGSGSYALYAPASVGNEEWVLVLSEVVQRETDLGRDVRLSSGGVPDETFVLEFSRDRNAFRLAWSNLGEWTWAALVDLEFRRTTGSEGERERGSAPRIDSKRGRSGTPPPSKRGERAVLDPGNDVGLARASSGSRASLGYGSGGGSRTPTDREDGRSRAGAGAHVRMADWGPPVTYWGGRP